MSDGSISQNEIDALLSGMGGSGSASAERLHRHVKKHYRSFLTGMFPHSPQIWIR